MAAALTCRARLIDAADTVNNCASDNSPEARIVSAISVSAREKPDDDDRSRARTKDASATILPSPAANPPATHGRREVEAMLRSAATRIARHPAAPPGDAADSAYRPARVRRRKRVLALAGLQAPPLRPLFDQGRCASGTTISKVAPPSSLLRTETRPLCVTMIFCTMARPRPVPCERVVKNG